MLPPIATLLTAVGALLAVLALIWLAGRAVRVGGLASRGRAEHVLSVRDVIPLDARRRLHLVHCAGHDVLLLTGGTQDVVVGWLGSRGPDVNEPDP